LKEEPMKSYGNRLLREGDEIGDYCPHCHAPLVCAIIDNRRHARCHCGRFLMHITEWRHWAAERAKVGEKAGW
jgi:hypothetical protein